MLVSALRAQARGRGSECAFWSEAAGALSWIELVDRASRLAGGLQASGFRRGDRLAVLLPNGTTLVEVFAACILSGLVFTPLNFRWTIVELAQAMDDARPSALIVDDAFAAIGRSAAAPTGVRVLDAGWTAAHSDALAPLFKAEPFSQAAAPTQDTLLAIFYTGGTTGRSKGVMLSHGNLGYNALATVAEGAIGRGEVVFHASPAFHIAGSLAIAASIMSGASGVLLPAFDPGRLISLIAERRITQGLLVPTMLGMVLDHPSCAGADLSSLTTVLYGAAPMPTALLERAMARLPGAEFLQLYGMTETSPVACVLHARPCASLGGRRERLGSAGRPILGSEVAIMDADGHEAERGTFGEICTRGPGVMLGYWNQPEATAEALRDGWMRTGDGGTMDDDGFIYLADRLKDMIISGGENVFSVEVENVIARHPAVRQCAVVGVPHPTWGEAVHAVVVPHAGTTLTSQDIIAFCGDRLTRFKQPRSVSIRAEPLPLSAAGKVLKRELREEVCGA